MKILLYVSRFSDAGGAEKVVTLMANHWSEIHDVIILSESLPENDFFQVDKNVTRVVSTFNIKSKNPFKQLKEFYLGVLSLRKILKDLQPDVIISHIDLANIRMLYAKAGLGIPIIVEDHNNPELKRLKQPWFFLKHFTYLLSDKIVLLTKDLQKFYPKYLYKKISFIANPLNITNDTLQQAEINLPANSFVALGSLTYQKGLDYMLEACAIIFENNQDWSLTILGEGPLRESVIKHSKALGIEDKVYLPGRVSNPYPVLQQAEIYLMSSRYEGFPVALCEAMGVGLPVISFDCPTGPADIIEHDVNGLLVSYLNVNQLAESMQSLIDSKEKREHFSKEALKINEKLSLDSIMSNWDNIIGEVTHG